MESTEVIIVNFKGNEEKLVVPRNQPILTSFLEENRQLPHSCREALCGKCAVKLIKGKIDMKDNFTLNEQKLKNGYVLLCQSFPITEQVVLQYK